MTQNRGFHIWLMRLLVFWFCLNILGIVTLAWTIGVKYIMDKEYVAKKLTEWHHLSKRPINSSLEGRQLAQQIERETKELLKWLGQPLLESQPEEKNQEM